MKRTVYDSALQIDIRDIPAEVANGREGGKMLTFVANETAEQIVFALPPDAVAEIHEGTKPPSKLQPVSEMPPFLKNHPGRPSGA